MNYLDPAVFDLEPDDDPPAFPLRAIVVAFLCCLALWLAVFWMLGLLP